MASNWEVTTQTGPIGDEVKAAAAAGLKAAADHVLQVALRHVPMEQGDLARTGKATVDDDALKACVSFDGPYAVKQHEDLQLQHDAGRTGKYLENAFNSEKAEVQQIIATAIRGAMEG